MRESQAVEKFLACVEPVAETSALEGLWPTQMVKGSVKIAGKYTAMAAARAIAQVAVQTNTPLAEPTQWTGLLLRNLN